MTVRPLSPRCFCSLTQANGGAPAGATALATQHFRDSGSIDLCLCARRNGDIATTSDRSHFLHVCMRACGSRCACLLWSHIGQHVEFTRGPREGRGRKIKMLPFYLVISLVAISSSAASVAWDLLVVLLSSLSSVFRMSMERQCFPPRDDLCSAM